MLATTTTMMVMLILEEQEEDFPTAAPGRGALGCTCTLMASFLLLQNGRDTLLPRCIDHDSGASSGVR